MHAASDHDIKPGLAALTLLHALDADGRPSFALESPSPSAHDEPLALAYSNAALHAVPGLLSKIRGCDSISLLAAAQMAFRDWVRGTAHHDDVQAPGCAYTFEGHVWYAFDIGGYRIISGMPTLLMWRNPGQGGRTSRKNSRENQLEATRHGRDISPTTPSLPVQLPASPVASRHSSSAPSCAGRRPCDYTSPRVLSDASPRSHIDYFHSVDWASTPLGPIKSWSADLGCMANMVLSNSAPAILYWGEDAIMLYNEPYIQLLGSLHPCMGKSFRTQVPEHWPALQTFIQHLHETGEPMDESDMLIFIERDGYLEETHWSFQFVPIMDRCRNQTAYYQTLFEVTGHRLLERRVSSLVEMGSHNANARNIPSFWDATLSTLSLNDKDVPLALLYAAERHVRAEMSPISSPGSNPPLEGCVLKGTVGVEAGHPIAPNTININDDSYFLHPFIRRAAESREPTVVHLKQLPVADVALEGIKWRGYGDPCHTAVVCPIVPTTGNQVEGFLIIGLNPRRPFDEDYLQYLQVMVRLLGTSLASVVLFEEEIRQRENTIAQAAQIQAQLMAEIKLEEGKFQRFAERSDVAIFTATPAGEYTYRNHRWYEMFEIAKLAVTAVEAWNMICFEEDLAYCESLFEKLVVNHENVCFELRTRIPWLPPSEASQTLPEDAQHFRWILCSAYPEMGPNGELIEVVGNVIDISRQKWSEGIQKSRTDSALQGKLHLEHFIDTTSHEMRNPLSAIMQCADSIISAFTHNEHHALTTRGPSPFLDSTLDAAQTIAQCAQHMRHIVDDILTISKLDSGLLDMTPVVTQPENVARHALRMFEGEAKAAGVDLSLVVDQSYRDLEIDWTSLDPTRVLQILINLITNAIKFTRLERVKSVRIALSASVAEPTSVPGGIQFNEEKLVEHDQHLEDDWKRTTDLIYLQFSVTDTGRGLSEEERGTLFTRFSQASPRTHINYGGSGLGLFISRRLTELQGGAIGLSSEPGKGSTFSFYIKTRRTIPNPTRNGSLPHVFPEDVKHRPLVNSSRPPPPLRTFSSEDTPTVRQFPTVPAIQSSMNRFHFGSESPSPSPRIEFRAPKAIKSAPQTLHVLVVEDNLVNQRVLAKQLRSLGCIVSVANHGREALEFLPKTVFWNHEHPLSISIVRKEPCHVPCTEPMPEGYDDAPPVDLSIILMDWEMPIMNGLTAVSEIRKLEQQGLLKARIPVIGVTANVRQQQIDTAMAAGMDHVVGKPFRVAELLVRMRGVVESGCAERERRAESFG
ncbi:uncharacterized protein SETTUDRAFT_168709 [Exserohilum turcica Et28A]|uniref:Ethylene receptor n=1 Tax=Exserohilum turcicum (strain 28A) TaxID=671987 RepID=R0ITC0_EXST2|nr:uncharacterized protein SETTUDRAFT_168709 [Exserohilum turcica Et28A]EOA87901.1 hypothetical protein SETTUDRAFT_168709 [Exserohilum turcica Et28A]